MRKSDRLRRTVTAVALVAVLARRRWRSPPAAATSELERRRPRIAATGDTIVGAGASFPYPALLQVGQRVQRRHRREAQLPVDRLRRRHLRHQGQDRRLRRLGRAARAGRARGRRPRRSSRMCVGGVVRSSTSRASTTDQLKLTGDARRQIYNGEITTWNDPAIAARQPRRRASRRQDQRRASLGRLGHDLDLHQLPRRGRRRRLDVRRRQGDRLADRRRRQGQRGRRRQRAAAQAARSATSSTPTPSRPA